MTGDADASLTTAQLAERTGVPAGTLRMREARHQFPVPVRQPGGHHRYTERDVESVQEVVRLRQEGLTMTAAIRRGLAAAGEPPTRSSAPCAGSTRSSRSSPRRRCCS